MQHPVLGPYPDVGSPTPSQDDNLSIDCKLSQIYTNHSIRATGTTLLSKARFNEAQIMSVTGHKSTKSLAIYERVDNDEKMIMGHTIAAGLVANPPQPRPALLPAPTLACTATHINSNDDQDFSSSDNLDLAGIDLEQLFVDFDSDAPTNAPRLPLANITNTVNQARSSQIPAIFHNCKIGNIHIHVSK